MSVEEIRDAIEEKTGVRPEGLPGSISGGCINDTFRLGDYFVKTNDASLSSLFDTELLGLQELHMAGALRVPDPICMGTTSTHAFLVLEFLPLDGRTMSSDAELGSRLARQHRAVGEQCGWERDNFIGATPQPNSKTGSWIAFFREHRLLHMLRLAEQCGYQFPRVERLLADLDQFFECEPAPSLLHGDLWAGNADALDDGTPVIFDPAVYFGDREVDLAMTRLFGGFSDSFYASYDEAWPLPAGHEARCELYNLYHILNHAVLFGGSYARQAQGIIDHLLGRL